MTERNLPDTPLSVRELGPADAPAMRALFERVFKKPMSPELWAWKYGRRGAAIGVWRGAELVAHYGGMGADIWYNGNPATAMQIGDVMVDPAERHAVRKNSPIFLATSAFLERFLGYGKPWLLGYGFPNDRAMGVALRLGCYAAVGRMWELSWTLATPPRLPLLLRALPLDAASLATHASAIDSLYAQLAADLRDRIVVRKDAQHLQWRYLLHPQERYELLLVKHRITGRPLGVCVLKREAERALWMEAIAPLANLPALAQVARVGAWRMGRQRLVLWCCEPDRERFGKAGGAQALPITIPANAWSPGPTPEELQDRWWLSAGDTDFL